MNKTIKRTTFIFMLEILLKCQCGLKISCTTAMSVLVAGFFCRHNDTHEHCFTCHYISLWSYISEKWYLWIISNNKFLYIGSFSLLILSSGMENSVSHALPHLVLCSLLRSELRQLTDPLSHLVSLEINVSGSPTV